MDLKKNVNPVVAVIIAIVVLIGVGFLSLKLLGGGGEKPVIVAKPDMNDPKFKQDPRLGGGGQ
jgi:hypothetical protein